jgi:hypothetical protein
MQIHPFSKIPLACILLSATIFALMSACRLFTGEITATESGNTTPNLLTYRATPAAQSPAAGICAGFEVEIVTLTIYPDIPDPRCVEVTSGQKLRVINRRTEVLHVAIGTFEADILPEGEYTFEVPVGEYLMPGVHVLQVSPCCSLEVVLKADLP